MTATVEMLMGGVYHGRRRGPADQLLGTFNEVRFEVALTLACAEDDELALLPVIEALKERGIRPEVVPGVDREPTMLGRAVDNGKPGLFLVCRSRLLDEGTFRRLEGLFSARRGPGQDLLSIEVDGVDRTVDAILERVAAFSGQDLVTGEHDLDEEASGENFRDVVQIRSVGDIAAPGATRSRTPAPPEDPERARRASPKPQHEPQPERKRKPRSPGAQPQRSQPPADRPAAQAKRSTAPSKPARDKTEREPQGIRREPAAPDLGDKETDKEGREPKWLVPVVAVAVLTFGALLVYRFVLAPGSRNGRGNQMAATNEGGAQSPAASTAGPESSVDTTEGSGGAATGDAPTASSGPAGTGESEDSGAATTEGGEEPDPPGDESERIENAIAKGKMRALDLLIVLPKGPELSWREAVDYCTLRRVGGVDGFRLPTSKELRNIRKARMLQTGDLYWSGTLDRQAGTGSDHVLALNDKNRLVPTAKDEPNGRPVCVRER